MILNFEDFRNQLNERETFNYMGAFEFDVDKCYELIKSKKIKYEIEKFDVKELAEQVLGANEYELDPEDSSKVRKIDKSRIRIFSTAVNTDYAMKLPGSSLHKPIGIIVNFEFKPGEFQGVIIDGNHRLFKAYFSGMKKAEFYVIEDQPTIDKFLHSRMPKTYKRYIK